MTNTTRAVVALGSNLGERELTLADACRRIAVTDGIELVAVSEFIDSVAVTLHGADPLAPAYLNAVALIDTSLSPEALLDALNHIETALGRVREERWGDRTLDLDIISFGQLTCDTPRLTIPHPRAAEREFVLAPWLSIDPEAHLPGLGSVRELLDRLSE